MCGSRVSGLGGFANPAPPSLGAACAHKNVEFNSIMKNKPDTFV